MSNEEIIKDLDLPEDGELLAKFIGYQILHKKYSFRNWNSSDESYFQNDEGGIVCDERGHEVNLYPDGDPLFEFWELPFNSDWNYLMLVVKRINEVDNFNELWEKHNIDKDNLTTSLKNVDIKTTFNLCLEFVKWYNEK